MRMLLSSSRPWCVADFETCKIGRRPHAYPPKPVGLALYPEGGRPEYFAFGHPAENNCQERVPRAKLGEYYRTHRVIFHNGPFDIEVAQRHWGLPWPEVWEDTMILAFLRDPRAASLSLKDLAPAWLGIRPKERDELRDWIVANVPGATPKDWGAYISQAPGGLVGRYAADGDAAMTLRLWRFLNKELLALDRAWPPDDGQQPTADAYLRELRLAPVIARMEADGIPIAVNRVKRDLPGWRRSVDELEAYIVRRLGGRRALARFATDADEGFNVDSPAQLANALEASGLVTHWKKTKKGNRSTKRSAMEEVLTDARLRNAMAKRSVLKKYVSTYGEKWLDGQTNGRVHPRINQVRNRENEGGSMAGARTGRLSYSDSWQAVPTVDRRPFDDLPVLRDYVVPPDGELVLVRDYSQQEFRILAHYEAGPLLVRYQADPTIDMHAEARAMILAESGLDFPRRPVKDTGFGILYGMGLETMSKKTGLDIETNRVLKRSYLRAIPGLKALQDDLKRRAKRGEPIRTWGGRLYWCEEPRLVDGRVHDFAYKMLNILVQGSAGDCTKEAMVLGEAALDRRHARIFMQVHDELGMLADRAHAKRQMALLREAMESVPFDVLMLTDGKWSARSWGAVVKYPEPAIAGRKH